MKSQLPVAGTHTSLVQAITSLHEKLPKTCPLTHVPTVDPSKQPK
jgi:hypothetical protein